MNATRASPEDEEPFLPERKALPRRPSRHWTVVFIFQWVIIIGLCAAVAHDYVILRQKAPRNGEEVYCEFLLVMSQDEDRTD